MKTYRGIWSCALIAEILDYRFGVIVERSICFEFYCYTNDLVNDTNNDRKIVRDILGDCALEIAMRRIERPMFRLLGALTLVSGYKSTVNLIMLLRSSVSVLRLNTEHCVRREAQSYKLVAAMKVVLLPEIDT